MEVTQANRNLVQEVADAMQAGAAGEEKMVSLFTDDGVLVEAFAGPVQTHAGKEAIRARYKEMVSMPRPDDFQLKVDQIWMEGDRLMADWTCTSVVLPAPLQGRDEFIVRDGKVARLEIVFKGGPPA